MSSNIYNTQDPNSISYYGERPSETRTVYINPNLHVHKTHSFANVHVNPNFRHNVHINPNFKKPTVHINPSVFSQPIGMYKKPSFEMTYKKITTSRSIRKVVMEMPKDFPKIDSQPKPVISTKTKLVRISNSESIVSTINKPVISTKTKLVRIKPLGNNSVPEHSNKIKTPFVSVNNMKPPPIPMKTKYKIVKPENSASKFKLDHTKPKNPYTVVKDPKKLKIDRTASSRTLKTKYKLRTKAYLMSLNPDQEIIKRPKIKLNGGAPKLVKIKDRIYKFSPNCDTMHLVLNNNKYKKVNPKKIIIGGSLYKQQDLTTYTFVKKLKNDDKENKPRKSIEFSSNNNTSPCIRFLQGDCFDKNCIYSHKLISNKIPTCKAYLEGKCEKTNCQYNHIILKENIEICKHFLMGRCKHGSECNKRHEIICPKYNKTKNCTNIKSEYPQGISSSNEGFKNVLKLKKGKPPRIFTKMGCVFQFHASKKFLLLIKKGPYNFKKIVVNGVQYLRQSPTLYIAVQNARNKIKINSKMLKKDNNPCIIYKRTGKCSLLEDGKCCKQHNPNQISICTRFLQGDCHEPNCLLSHKVSSEKMPTCKFFLLGMCHKNNCQYLHVKLSAKASICRDFLAGFCQKGIQCDKRHQFLCPIFEEKSSCPKKKCPYPHGTAVRQYTDKILNRIARNTNQKINKKLEVIELPKSLDVSNNIDEKPDPSVRYYHKDASEDKIEIVEKSEESSTNETEENICDSNENSDLKTNLLLNRPQLGLLPSFIPFDN